MNNHQISAYIIPSSDPHQGEYVAHYWKGRAWISGFTGSAGTAAVTMKEAGVWTDSRYFIQGEEELKGSGFDLYKVYNQDSPQYIDWIIENLDAGDTVACDGRLFSKRQLASFEKKLTKNNLKLDATLDLIAEIWGDRPSLPQDPIFELEITYAGESRSSKLKRIRSQMKDQGADYHLVSTLDDIAWIFNIRGKDVQYNPVAYSYALITHEAATLFIDIAKVPTNLIDLFEMENIDLKPYDNIWKALNEIPVEKSILVDNATISYALARAINTRNIIDKTLPSIGMKALKNEVEIQHFRNVMIKDGVALTRFYIWLENNIHLEPSEYDLVQKIAEFRSLQQGYQSESFGAIVGYKGNGAIVHYSPSAEKSAKIKPTGVLLIDSGGQYLDGTTDITRTITLGQPSNEEKDAYTRVLKGNIALDRAVFPEGTLGVQLDTLARFSLWEKHLNFLHGTGHGVGFFLNVHEGPQGFHPGVASKSKNSIEEHMVTTNEPGYYASGKFGIRIENCLLTVKSGNSDSGKFLKFETLTLFPIDTALIALEIMSPQEIEWLNKYHVKVYEKLSPFLDDSEKTWLNKKCEAV
ncbi:Xaa-Pro aminopeptidase [Portibacter lacus]|uniref:Xaa-Pro aminopeptidase n=2 Tax=Portibacter lacus TaxID=1099794 RepID=A0AA37SNJ3_9BACT|nr:Xaa-Pro aminopeptidase [Portibacter lacus]